MITMTPETNKQMLTETIKYRFATAAARRQVQSWGRRPDILGRTANRLQGDISSLQDHLLLLLVHGGDDHRKQVFEQSLLEEVHRERGRGKGASCRERVHIPCILIISGMEHYENHKPSTFCQLSMYKFSWINCKQKQIWRTNWLFKTNSITKQSKTGAIISKFQYWIDLDQVSFSYASVKLSFCDIFWCKVQNFVPHKNIVS